MRKPRGRIWGAASNLRQRVFGWYFGVLGLAVNLTASVLMWGSGEQWFVAVPAVVTVALIIGWIVMARRGVAADTARVDVLVARSVAGELRPPSRSIMDGGGDASVVRIDCLRQPFRRGVGISLTVDPVTARRFARSAAIRSVGERRALPVMLIALVVLAGSALVAEMIESSSLMRVVLLLLVTLVLGGVVTALTLLVQPAVQHPRVRRDGTILLIEVDRAAAQEWSALNPGDVEIVSR